MHKFKQKPGARFAWYRPEVGCSRIKPAILASKSAIAAYQEDRELGQALAASGQLRAAEGCFPYAGRTCAD